MVATELILNLFMSRIAVHSNTGCWLWTGSKTGRGSHRYGSFVHRGERKLAHRFSYEHFNGPIPYKKVVCHKCDVTACVNPEHLFIGTQSDNMRDCRDKNRLNHRFGTTHGNNKLSEEAVLDIYNQKLRGTMTLTLARKYNVSTGVIVSIMSGRSWRWLTGVERKNAA